MVVVVVVVAVLVVAVAVIVAMVKGIKLNMLRSHATFHRKRHDSSVFKANTISTANPVIHSPNTLFPDEIGVLHEGLSFSAAASPTTGDAQNGVEFLLAGSCLHRG